LVPEAVNLSDQPFARVFAVIIFVTVPGILTALHLELQHQREQQLERARVGVYRAVDEPGDDRLPLAEAPAPPPSSIVTVSASASCSSVVRVLPRGRPPGLPERPFAKRVCTGGLP
jgi:hypothetical protein